MIANNRKRKYSFSEIDDRILKKPHVECTYDLENESNQEMAVIFDNTYENNECKSYFVRQLSRIIYRYDLTILCVIRKLVHKEKYPLLSLTLNNNEINEFNDIGIHYDGKSICIKLENLDTSYIENRITYTKLFCKKNQSFSINNYFNNFVKYVLSPPNDLTSNVEHLIIYTNSTLDLTDENSLKCTRDKNFYPFQFKRIDTGECSIIKDFLYISNHQDSKIYRFSQDQHTKTEFLKRLEFSSVVQKLLRKYIFPMNEKQIKEDFFKKLIFFVSQPHREKLKDTVKNELGKCHHYYVKMFGSLLKNLMASKNLKPSIMYEFTVLISIMHDMIQYKKVSSVNIKSTDTSNIITVCYKKNMTYIAVHDVSSEIGYTQLFPSKRNGKKNFFCINQMYALYAQQLKKNEKIKFCIFYTNTHLSLTNENKLKNDASEEFFPIKFTNVDVQKKRFKFLRDLLCINTSVVYQFSSEESTLEYVINLLELPCLLKSNLDITSERQREIKQNFLHKLVFVCEQPNVTGLNSILSDHINESNTFYDFEQLSELAIRWSESHRSVPATERLMRKLLDDIKNNRSSYQKIENKNITEEIQFTKNVINGGETTLIFIQFLDYITIGQGSKYLEVMKNHGIKIQNISSILNKTMSAQAISALDELYDLLFDKHGHETQYLKTIKKYEIQLASVGSILRGSTVHAANAFKNLYYLWFDEVGNQRVFLKTLKREKIKLSTMSSILAGAGVNASRAFKDLYDFWFDDQGNKTRYLKNFENNGVNLFRMSSILSHSGKDAAKSFKELHDLWFDEEGNKTKYLKTMKENKVNLVNFSTILNGTGPNVTTIFKNLYKLWFRKSGEKSKYLKTLENNKINLTITSSLLTGSRSKAVDAFKKLYYFWFDKNGNKTQYLNLLEKEGIDLRTMCNIVSGASFNAPKVLKDLHDMLFDESGTVTQYLKTLKDHGIMLTPFFDTLHSSRSKAVQNFIALHNVLIGNEGGKTRYLQCLENNNITIVEMAKILRGAGMHAPSSFKSLCNLWFGEDGEKTEYLKICEKNYMTLNDVCKTLKGTCRNAPTKFKDLCRSFESIESF